MPSKQSKAKKFDQETIKRILRRDGGCIFCNSKRWELSDEYGKKIFDIAHIVNRSQGGLGIEQNGVTACRAHHMELDNGNKGWREGMQQYVEEYMKALYPDWNRENLIYRKYKEGICYR